MTTTAQTYRLPMQQDVAAFHDAFDMPNLAVTPGPLPLDRIELRLGLIREEGVDELKVASARGDLVEIIDALIDTIYVSLGALVEMGQPADVSGSDGYELPSALRASMLIETGRAAAISNEIFLTMLEQAFRKEETERSAEILNALVSSSIVTLVMAGVNPKPFFDEVQRANMSKLDKNGKPVHSRGMELDGYPAGKVLKGANYRAPDLAKVFADTFTPDEQRQRVETIPYPTTSVEFRRGVREGIAAMRLFFLNEDEGPMYDFTLEHLEQIEKGAETDAILDEEKRIAAGRPAL